MATVTQFPLRLSDGSVITDTPEILQLREELKSERELRSKSNAAPRLSSSSTITAATTLLAQALQNSNELLEAYDLSEIDEHIYKRIKLSALDALKVLEDIISGRLPASVAIRAKVASMHLSRAGFPPVTKVQSVTGYLSRDDIEAIKQHHVTAVQETLTSQETSSEV
jgi:hypothetical protein